MSSEVREVFDKKCQEIDNISGLGYENIKVRIFC